MVKKARKKVSSYATGGPSTTAQGLPSPSPVGGFKQGPESNQFGSWGAAVEQGGIPGSTEGLQLVGNPTTPFNPGDQVAAQGIAAPAPNVQSTYYAPTPPPPPSSTVYNFNSTTPPPAPTPKAPAAAPPPPPAPTPAAPKPETAAQGAAANGYVTANGQLIYNPTLAQQYLRENPIGGAEGGVIPAYTSGGIAPETTVDPNAGLSAQYMADAQQQAGRIMNSPQMQQGVQRAVDMAKKSFGIDLPSAASLLGNTRPTAAQSGGGSQMEQANNQMQAAISGMQRHAKGGGVPAYNAGGDAIAHGGGVPTYDDGGDVSSDSGGGGGGYGGGNTTQATSEPAPASIPSQAPASDDRSLFQKAVAYFSGAGAMAQDQFNALKQRVVGDQTQGASPTKQNMAVLDAAAEMGPEVASGAVQHLKAQYEPRRMQAARALEAGHLDVGAKDATDAMGFVPDAHEVSFIPHQNGVSAIIQDPEGKTSKADFPAPTLAGILKSAQSVWDNVTQKGAGSIFGQTPDQSNQFGAVGRGLEAVRGAVAPTGRETQALASQGKEPTFAAQNKEPEVRPEDKPEDRPYGGLNPADEGGGAGGGFGGNIPGAPAKEPPIKGVKVRQGLTGNEATRADEAKFDRQFAAHQAQDKSTLLASLPRGGAGTPETLRVPRSAAVPSGRIDVEGTLQDYRSQRRNQEASMNNAGLPAEAQIGQRLAGGARRIRDQSELPRGWSMMAAEDPRGGWIAVPPGVAAPPEAHPERETAPGFTPGTPEARANQAPHIVHNIAGGAGGGERFYALNERLPYTNPQTGERGTYELPSHQVNLGLPQRGQPQPHTRGAPIDRGQITGTAQAQIDQRRIQSYISGLQHRQQAGEQLTEQEQQDLTTYGEQARGLLHRGQGAPVTVGGQGNYPTLKTPNDVSQLPGNIPFFRDPNGVLRHNPNYRSQ